MIQPGPSVINPGGSAVQPGNSVIRPGNTVIQPKDPIINSGNTTIKPKDNPNLSNTQKQKAGMDWNLRFLKNPTEETIY